MCLELGFLEQNLWQTQDYRIIGALRECSSWKTCKCGRELGKGRRKRWGRMMPWPDLWQEIPAMPGVDFIPWRRSLLLQPLPDLSSTNPHWVWRWTSPGDGQCPRLEGLTVVINTYRQASIYVITLFAITVLFPHLVPWSESFLINLSLLFGTPIYKHISHLVF